MPSKTYAVVSRGVLRTDGFNSLADVQVRQTCATTVFSSYTNPTSGATLNPSVVTIRVRMRKRVGNSVYGGQWRNQWENTTDYYYSFPVKYGHVQYSFLPDPVSFRAVFHIAPTTRGTFSKHRSIVINNNRIFYVAIGIRFPLPKDRIRLQQTFFFFWFSFQKKKKLLLT